MWTILMKLDLTSVCLALFLGLIFMVLFEIFRINSCRGQIPPGPKPLPFLGVLPQLIKKPMEFIRSVSQYGEISTMYIGRKPTIVLNTIQVTKEALVQEAFSGRPSMPLIEWITNGLGIIMVTFGHSWKQQRRFALHTLRNFGLGKKSVEDRVLEESRYLIAEMLKAEGKSMNPQHAIQNAVSNIICSIVFGERFDYDNKRFSYLLKILNENFMLAGSAAGQIFNIAPFIKHFPGPHQKVMRNGRFCVWNFFAFTLNSRWRVFINDPDSTQTSGTGFCPPSTLTLFYIEVQTLFSTSLLSHNTERCHEEIVRVLGYDRLPSMNDRDKLPYTYATVHEIQRYANIVPLGVIHETIRPTNLRGYDIPQVMNGAWMNDLSYLKG
uniref:Cytochrome P450, family 2, subfamily R, polypeptide 1 n=1 Tax=Sinocyclocheilus rhinocerous TaxID=307959 RepID=A0A673MX84_9TELE